MNAKTVLLRKPVKEPNVVERAPWQGDEFSEPLNINSRKSIAGNRDDDLPLADDYGYRHRDFALCVVHFSFASALLALYSRNIVSSMIRIIIGI
jgi:hypothetical protein